MQIACDIVVGTGGFWGIGEVGDRHTRFNGVRVQGHMTIVIRGEAKGSVANKLRLC